MRRTLILLIALSLVSGLAAVAEELGLEQILDNYYEAIGGKEKWKAVQSMRQTGQMQMGPMQATFNLSSARPNKMRLEFEVQGMTAVQAYDGENGWMLMPFMGSTEPEPMPEEMVDMIASDTDLEGILIDYADKGHTVELVGVEDIEGTPAYRLDVTLQSGHELTMYLDQEYFIPIASRTTNTLQGQEMTIHTTLSDYKEVEGLMIPHAVSSKMDMGEQAMTIETVELNVELADEIFAMPEDETVEGEPEA